MALGGLDDRPPVSDAKASALWDRLRAEIRKLDTMDLATLQAAVKRDADFGRAPAFVREICRRLVR